MSTNEPTPKKTGLDRLIDRRRTQASLFHYVKETPEPSIWSEVDWSFLRHPIRTLNEEWKTPRTRASLFHYIDDEVAEPFSFKEFLRDLVFGSPSPNFIPSVFSADAGGIAVSPAEFRAGRRRATLISFLVHVTIVALALVLVYRKTEPLPPKDNIVFVTPPFLSPFEGDGRDGGGGGGGGKGEKTPPSSGRMPETTRVQFTPPDPSEPHPLIPPDDLVAPLASIVMPIDIPQDTAIPIGDVQAPKNDRASSGPGSGGGIGTGQGTGIGSGIGPGAGPGSGGGMGGGSGGGIGTGVGPYVQGAGLRPPTPILQPLPAYTEDARKARIEGLVLIQAVVRKDGSVDSFKVLRGLGHGLDESAIQTIATKWRFRPGTMKGEPVDVQCNIEVSFRLY